MRYAHRGRREFVFDASSTWSLLVVASRIGATRLQRACATA